MKLDNAMRIAAVCGLQSVDEAVYNVELHAMSLFLYDKVDEELRELYAEYDTWIDNGQPNEIPRDIIEDEQRKMDEYFASLGDIIPEPVMVEWLDEDSNGQDITVKY